MEVFLLSNIQLLVLFTTITVSIITIIRGKYYWKNGGGDEQYPPGPPRLPIIGNIHQMIGYLPQYRLRDLSKTYGPLMHLKLGEVSMVVASSPEAAQEITKTYDLHFASRPLFPSIDLLTYGGKDMTFAPYGEYWRQLRKICVMELLSPKVVATFRSTREAEVRNLIQSISSSSSNLINLSETLSKTINNLATVAAVGAKCKDQTAFLELTQQLLEEIAGFNLADLFPSLSWIIGTLSGSRRNVERIHLELDRTLEDIIHDHKEEKKKLTAVDMKEDLADVLLRLQGDDGLPFEMTKDCVKALLLDVTIAGSETTSSVLVWAMAELMKNPRVMKRAQLEMRQTLRGKAEVTESDIRELDYLKLVIKETLRLHPQLPLLVPRECQETCKILGYVIPKKTRVVVNAWAIGRDPKYWEDAQEFKPERFEGSCVDYKGTNFEFLPFGSGRRMCPGMSFGIANVELPLAQLLYHFDWHLPNGIDPESLDMTETFGISARKSSHLYLHAIPHIPAGATSCYHGIIN